MKNLERMTKQATTPEEEEVANDPKKSNASKIMTAVAKAVQTTPGKKGKKATKGPKKPSKPGSPRQTKDFNKSSYQDIPFNTATDPQNTEMD